MRLHKLLFLTIASLLLAAPVYAEDPKPVPIIATMPARHLPPITWKNACGHTEELDPAQNKLTVLHIWATWCVPCIKELPQLDAVYSAYKSKGLEVVPLALDGAKIERIEEFYKQHKILWLTANFDALNASFKAVGGKNLPLTVFINARGEEVGRAEGWRSGAVQLPGSLSKTTCVNYQLNSFNT